MPAIIDSLSRILLRISSRAACIISLRLSLSSVLRRSSSWRKMNSLEARALSSICLALSVCFSISSSLRAILRLRSSSAFRLKFSYSWRSFSASSRAFSISIRLVSRRSITSSKFLFSRLISWLARAIMSSEIPSFSEIAKAFDLPGVPTISLYVGRRVSISNSQDAFCTPGVSRA